jgi:hypothetical protein
MIERDLLQDLGFVKCESESEWDHEVWYHPIDFWVHYDVPPPDDRALHWTIEAYALYMSRSEFLKNFLYGVEEHFISSASVHYNRVMRS